MIDADPATDGLSLFLLGPKVMRQVSSFEPRNTFVGILRTLQDDSPINFEPRTIHRAGKDDHGVSYEAIISGEGLYGDDLALTARLAVPDLSRPIFRKAVRELFEALRKSGLYSYILVDTRGGFAFESTDVCALADSFIVVTEPDYTSFYQDRNLVRRISQASKELNSSSILRAFIVNKATEGDRQGEHLDLAKLEQSFRLELSKEFPVQFEETHPVPVDLEALKAYKTQRIPYLVAPSSPFSFATLSAFSDILQVFTSRWSKEQVEKWNELITAVSNAIEEKNKKTQLEQQEKLSRERDLNDLRVQLEKQSEKLRNAEREIVRLEKFYERELDTSKYSGRTKQGGMARELLVKGGLWRLFVTSLIYSVFSAILLFATTPSLLNECSGGNTPVGGLSQLDYQLMLKAGSARRGQSQGVGLVTLTSGFAPPDVLANPCVQRLFMARLIRRLNDLNASVIALDKSYDPNACDPGSMETQALFQAISKSHAVIIRGLSTELTPVQQVGEHKVCLRQAPALGLPVPDQNSGLLRLAPDPHNIPLSWPVLHEDGKTIKTVSTFALATARAARK